MDNLSGAARNLFGDDEIPENVKKIFPGSVAVPLTKADIRRQIQQQKSVKHNQKDIQSK